MIASTAHILVSLACSRSIRLARAKARFPEVCEKVDQAPSLTLYGSGVLCHVARPERVSIQAWLCNSFVRLLPYSFQLSSPTNSWLYMGLYAAAIVLPIWDTHFPEGLIGVATC